eukprot:1190624-Prorocentrum_minimum.AAC.5
MRGRLFVTSSDVIIMRNVRFCCILWLGASLTMIVGMGYICTVQDMWAGEEAAKLDRQASTEAVGMGDRWRGGRAAPGTSPTSEVPGAQNAPRQNQGSTRQAPPG